MSEALAQFAFLRPSWLLALLPLAALWLAFRHLRGDGTAQRGGIAPHLLQHLLVAPRQRPWLRPQDVVLPLGVLLIIAVAGPSWRYEQSAFAEEQSALMVVLRAAESMTASDVAPSRLERAQHKIRDLGELRPGAGLGLIAYDGSAHVVMPITRDARVVAEVAEALTPEVMPVEGDALAAAIDLAATQLRAAHGRGSILVITDSVARDQDAALRLSADGRRPPVQFLAAVGSREAAVNGGVFAAAGVVGADVELLTPDRSDVERISRAAESMAATSAGDGARRKDEGYLLVPLILLGLLPWARHGWSLRWD